MALIDGLISYYVGDEASGNIIDVHGSNDGAATGLSYGETGKLNNALGFSASNARFVSSLPISSWTGMTWVGWIDANTTAGVNMFFSSLHSNEDDIRFQVNNDQILASFDDGTISTVSFAYTSTGVKTFIIITHDGSTLRLIVDGFLRAAVADTYNFAGHTGSTSFFGARHDLNSTFDFDGIMNNNGVWNRALTFGGVSVGQAVGGEAGELWNSGAGLAYPFGAEVGTFRQIKISGTFVEKPILTKVAGTFVNKPIKIKVGGTFQDA